MNTSTGLTTLTISKLSVSQKGLAPILIILILAALVGGYLVYYNQPKPTPSPSPADTSPAPTGAGETANWKTYISICGFSVDYPGNYEVKQKAKNCASDLRYPESTNIEEGSIISPDNGRTLWVNIEVDTKVKASTIDELLASAKYRLAFPKNLVETTTISESPAVELKLQENEQAGFRGGVDTVVGILRNGKFIQFKVQGDESAIQIWDQILSTFKFLP